jgi:hypothetical protein
LSPLFERPEHAARWVSGELRYLSVAAETPEKRSLYHHCRGLVLIC